MYPKTFFFHRKNPILYIKVKIHCVDDPISKKLISDHIIHDIQLNNKLFKSIRQTRTKKDIYIVSQRLNIKPSNSSKKVCKNYSVSQHQQIHYSKQHSKISVQKLMLLRNVSKQVTISTK